MYIQNYIYIYICVYTYTYMFIYTYVCAVIFMYMYRHTFQGVGRLCLEVGVLSCMWREMTADCDID